MTTKLNMQITASDLEIADYYNLLEIVKFWAKIFQWSANDKHWSCLLRLIWLFIGLQNEWLNSIIDLGYKTSTIKYITDEHINLSRLKKRVVYLYYLVILFGQIFVHFSLNHVVIKS